MHGACVVRSKPSLSGVFIDAPDNLSRINGVPPVLRVHPDDVPSQAQSVLHSGTAGGLPPFDGVGPWGADFTLVSLFNVFPRHSVSEINFYDVCIVVFAKNFRDLLRINGF